MDLESERSPLDSLRDNRLTSTNPTAEKGEEKEKLKADGLSANGIPDIGSSGNTNLNASPQEIDIAEGAGIEKVENSVSSQTLSAKSPAGGSPPAAKGFGLRKWRRIKRDVVKDGSASVDSGKAHKRILPTSGNPSKSTDLARVEIKPNSEDSVGSVNMFKNTAGSEEFVTRGSSLESRFDVGSAFAAGTDSDNSEDRSSRSSTAASASRMRYDLPTAVGCSQQMNRIKNVNRTVIGRSGHRVQQGKGHAESSKKLREEKVKMEQENSHSSNESDSRGSNFVFMQGNYSVTSNRKQNGNSMNYNGENSDGANVSEQLLGKEALPGYARENIGEVEGLLEDGFVAEASWKGRERKDENHQPAINKDPLLESIQSLQAVQEALENEVRKLAEVGTINMRAGSSYSDLGVQESSSPNQFNFENVMQSSLLESQLCSLTENIKHLESSLEETSGLLKVKESRVAELEATLNDSQKQESGNLSDFLQEKCRELELDYESLFKQKIEAEIECLALARTIEKLRVTAGAHVTLFEQQEALAGDHVQMLKKLGQAESKVATLRKRSDNLEEYRGDILETEEVLKMQRRVCNVTTCFFVQLILLVLVFWLVVLQLSPHAGVVVPT